MCLKNEPSGIPSISLVHCFIEKCWGENNGVIIPHSRKEFSNAEKALPENNFNSLLDAYDKLYAKIITFPHIGYFPQAANYLDAF